MEKSEGQDSECEDDGKDTRKYERSYCDCLVCQVPCRTLPGFLASSDLERIALYAIPEIAKNVADRGKQMDEYNEWVADNFVASQDSTGHQVIRPAVDNSGSCVFFDGNKCTIHPVAPFECRTFKPCRDSFIEYNIMLHRVAAYCSALISYLNTWKFLKLKGLESDFVKSWRLYAKELKDLMESGKLEKDDDEKE